MARKQKKKMKPEEPESKYNIAEILMEYAYDIMPDEDEVPEPDEIVDYIDQAVALCATAWNYAAFPDDFQQVYIEQAEKLYVEASLQDEEWPEMKEMLIEMAEDMRDNYPDGDFIVIGHEISVLEDQGISVEMSLLPLEDALAAFSAADAEDNEDETDSEDKEE